MPQMFSLYGQPFYWEVINRIGCNECSMHCDRVPVNQYFAVMNNIKPMYYFYQIPSNIVRFNTNGYLYADSSMMQDNFIYYWSRNIYSEHERSIAQEELKRVFKTMLEIASKETENTNPQISIFFDEVGFVMADNFTEALRKAYNIYKKYMKLADKGKHANY